MINSQNKIAVLLQKVLPVLFTLLYLSSPSQNPTADAYDYAAGLKWGFDLFEAHHLLHQLPVWFIYKALQATGYQVDALELSTALSSLYLGGLLLTVAQILKIKQVGSFQIIGILLILGLSASIMRFSTINEVYILPIAMSSLGILYFEKYNLSKSLGQGIVAVLALTIAILVHQIQIWWWLAIALACLYGKDWKMLALFFGSTFLIVLAYHLVAIYYYDIPNSFFSSWLLFTDVYQKPGGTSALSLTSGHFLLTAISFIRTWITIPVSEYFAVFLWPIVIFGSIVVGYGVFIGLKSLKFRPKFVFSWELGTILMLLVFSLFSMGNIEFLVGLPVLVMFYCTKFSFPNSSLYWIACGLAIANLPAQLFYHHNENFSSTEEFYSYSIVEPRPALLIRKPEMDAYSLYETGKVADWAIYPSSVKICDSVARLNRCFYTDINPQKNTSSRADWLVSPEIVQWVQKNKSNRDSYRLYLWSELAVYRVCPNPL